VRESLDLCLTVAHKSRIQNPEFRSQNKRKAEERSRALHSGF
jgi:hypothetical protein